MRELEDANRARVKALLDDGLTVREIADETGIPKSTVRRIKKAIDMRRGAQMPSDPDLLILAQAVLDRKPSGSGTSTWDKRGTSHENLSQRAQPSGTVRSVTNHNDNPSVPLSHALGDGTLGQAAKSGTALGTSGPYRDVLVALCSKCPELVEPVHWQQATRDAENFLSSWSDQAHALGWTARELFGLHSVPDRPAANYRRLSRLMRPV